jgi:hypothetical protein
LEGEEKMEEQTELSFPLQILAAPRTARFGNVSRPRGLQWGWMMDGHFIDLQRIGALLRGRLLLFGDGMLRTSCPLQAKWLFTIGPGLNWAWSSKFPF